MNDDGLFIDSMSVERLAAAMPFEIRLSKDFADALRRAGGRVSKPTVAIVGRPNVGKSTLFNRIVGGRPRDRVRAAGHHPRPPLRRSRVGRAPLLAGGHRRTGARLGRFDGPRHPAQVEFALDEADVMLFRGRRQGGPATRWIAAIADRLRKARRPVLLAVNKLDDLERSTAQYDFYQLGFGDPLGVSAAVGKGSGDLLDAIVERLPPLRSRRSGDRPIDVAVVGRPNVGKSSLVNRLLGEERHVVAPEAGTTRDAIDSPLAVQGQDPQLH